MLSRWTFVRAVCLFLSFHFHLPCRNGTMQRLWEFGCVVLSQDIFRLFSTDAAWRRRSLNTLSLSRSLMNDVAISHDWYRQLSVTTGVCVCVCSTHPIPGPRQRQPTVPSVMSNDSNKISVLYLMLSFDVAFVLFKFYHSFYASYLMYCTAVHSQFPLTYYATNKYYLNSKCMNTLCTYTASPSAPKLCTFGNWKSDATPCAMRQREWYSVGGRRESEEQAGRW